MEATLTSFWVSLPGRAGPEPRSWPRLTSTTFSQVSSPGVQHMNQGEGRKHSEHSPERMRCDTSGRGYKERGEKGECKAHFVSGATINNEWSTVLGKAPEGGKKGPGKRPHVADTELTTTRTDLRCQSLQLPWTTTLRNDLSSAPLSKKQQK